jgi:nitrous oxide reductase accessory protein NosL
MKKLLIIALSTVIISSCTKEHDFAPTLPQQASEELKIANSMGIKLQSPFVTSEVAMNVKSETAGTVTIKILDIGNRVVSKETVNVIVGDNILKVYTTALPPSAYRIGFYDTNNNLLGITDFNKIN